LASADFVNQGTTATVLHGNAAGNPSWAAVTNTVAPPGRLTLTSGTPITTADVTAATNIYYLPYLGNLIQLWDGSAWTLYTFAELTLAIGTLTSGKPYDVFVFQSSGTATLEVGPVWTNDTTRATAVTLQDGRYCKSGDKTRLYLGTFYTTSTTTTEDSAAKRYLFNNYNRAPRFMRAALETADSWAYSTATYRQANANTANQLNYVDGSGDIRVDVNVRAMISSSGATQRGAAAGIGVDSTSVNSAFVYGTNVTSALVIYLTANYVGHPGLGRRFLVWLEKGAGTADVQSWFGDAGDATTYQSGIFGTLSN
jgi:hypothetical protein